MAKSKITEEQKAEIRRLHDEAGLSYAALAVRFDVAPITINRICKPDLAARQAAAQKEYRQKNGYAAESQVSKQTFRIYSFRCHRENDKKIIDHLDRMENYSEYLRGLIQTDMDKNSGDK